MTRHDMAQQFCQPISFNSYQFEWTHTKKIDLDFLLHDLTIRSFKYSMLLLLGVSVSQCRGGKRRPCVNLMHRCDQTKFTYFTYLHTCTDVILTYFTTCTDVIFTYFTNLHRCDQTWEHIQRAREAEAWWWIVQLLIVACEKIAISIEGNSSSQ